MKIRAATPEDAPAIGQIAEAASLFPADALPGIIAPAFDGAPDRWWVAMTGASPEGFAFARPEEMTDRTWNILALAVHPDAHRKGLARALLKAAEEALDARMIIIETTQLPEQEAARAFYTAAGYEIEGTVRDFFGAGEDKVIFRKVPG